LDKGFHEELVVGRQPTHTLASGSGEICVPTLPLALEAISVAAFLFYGIACLLSPKLEVEFTRYQLARWRVMVGWLEIAGAVGLVVGQWFPLLKVAAAAGLVLLMLCGLWARWRVRDPWYAMAPAFVLAVVNFFIFLSALRSL
jgi:hypothetical protein